MKSEKPKLVIWGASGHARVVADIVRLAGLYELHGFLDDVDPQPRTFLGLPVFGGRDRLAELKEGGVTHFILGFGNCQARLKLAEVVGKEGLRLGTAIHPRAIVADDVAIGAGSVVAAGAIINPGSSIGENVIVNTGASIDHDCVVGDGAHVCPGVAIGGGVSVGRGAWVGIGSTVKDHVSIGAFSLVGAGSVVVTDIPDSVVAYGVPARVRKEAS